MKKSQSPEQIKAKLKILQDQLDIAVAAEQEKLLVAAAPFKDRLPTISEEQRLLIQLGNLIYSTWYATSLFGGLNSRQKQIFDLLNTGETQELMRSIHKLKVVV
jgi:hypothetical protein